MKRDGRHGTWHHIISSYLGGPDIPANKYRWDEENHQAYHELFHHYLPSITIKIIKLWTGRDGKLVRRKVGHRGMLAWRNAFGNATPHEAIAFIAKNFLPVEKQFLRGKLGGEKNGKG